MTTTGDWFEVFTIADLIVRAATAHPQRIAVTFPDESRTYAQLLSNATSVARGLLALGVKPGNHIGIMSANCPEFIEGLIGASMLGCVVVPINARHKASEIGYIVENADLVALLTTAEENEYTSFTRLFTEALPTLATSSDPAALSLPEAPMLRATILLKGQGRPGFVNHPSFRALAETVQPEEVQTLRQRVRIQDTALIVYTSGTTANPKGCMLTHEAIVRGSVYRARTIFATEATHKAWNPGPLFHIAALAPFLGVMGVMGTYVTDTYFDPGRAVALLEREQVDMIWPWFPAIVQGVLDHPDFDAKRLQSVRKVMLIGPPALVRRVQATFPGAEIFQACGMTETSGIFAITKAGETEDQRAHTQGQPCAGVEVRIASLAGEGDVAPGEVGEILVRAYCVMQRYYKDPQKTAESLDPDGWLRTGDLYQRREDGSLVFNGRLKDMLKVGGENVAAIEIEAFLSEHPAVRTAEVIGKPDPRLDEVPVAFVELKPDQTATAEDLISFCKDRISSYKVPREVYFMQPGTWPMSATKVNKRALRERLELR